MSTQTANPMTEARKLLNEATAYCAMCEAAQRRGNTYQALV